VTGIAADSATDRRWPISLAIGLVLTWVLLILATAWMWLHEPGEDAWTYIAIGVYLVYPLVVAAAATRSRSPRVVLWAAWAASVATMVVAALDQIETPQHPGVSAGGFGLRGALVGAVIVSTWLLALATFVSRVSTRGHVGLAALVAVVATAVVSYLALAFI
jgi:hypothetical protein